MGFLGFGGKKTETQPVQEDQGNITDVLQRRPGESLLAFAQRKQETQLEMAKRGAKNATDRWTKSLQANEPQRSPTDNSEMTDEEIDESKKRVDAMLNRKGRWE